MTTPAKHRYGMEELLGELPPKWRPSLRSPDTYTRDPEIHVKKMYADAPVPELWLIIAAGFNKLPDQAAQDLMKLVAGEDWRSQSLEHSVTYKSAYEAMAIVDTMLEEHGL